MTGPHGSSNTDNGSPERSRLREILEQQYLLHEVQHQGVLHGDVDSRPSRTRTPVAHQLVDIYKCLHQGEFGIGHNIDNEDRFRSRLHQEILSRPPGAEQPLLEIISADGTTARLNLRPFRKRFTDSIDHAVDGLVEVCLESARRTRGDPGRFLRSLHAFRDLNAARELRVGRIAYVFNPLAVDRFLYEVRDLARQLREIPVLGHSAVYRQMNAPAYRVIDREVLKRSALGGFIDF